MWVVKEFQSFRVVLLQSMVPIIHNLKPFQILHLTNAFLLHPHLPPYALNLPHDPIFHHLQLLPEIMLQDDLQVVHVVLNRFSHEWLLNDLALQRLLMPVDHWLQLAYHIIHPCLLLAHAHNGVIGHQALCYAVKV